MNIFVSGCKQIYSTDFSEKKVTECKHKTFTSASLELDKNSPFYPKRGDEKIMRSDTAMAVVAVQQLLAEAGIKISREETALYVASGVFIENIEDHLGHLMRALEKIKDAKTEADKINLIFRASPPLLALQTLTNSTMSFVAQYVGIKGNNATFGNTSLSGFHALEAAVAEVTYTDNCAVVVASNVGGEYSFMMNSSLYPHTEGWKESGAVGTVLLTKKPTPNSLCRITQMATSTHLPNLHSTAIQRNWKNLLPDTKSDAIIHSGAYTEAVFQADDSYCKKLNKPTASFFTANGNMGSANVLASLQKGIDMLAEGRSCIDLLDRDIYGRESAIRIEALK
ncbi:MAG: hypothetical protein WDZ35_09875 [Crocinitomicaceae bacterium]